MQEEIRKMTETIKEDSKLFGFGMMDMVVDMEDLKADPDTE
jgi:hypothetical protein